MNISFSTVCESSAKDFLNHQSFNYLNQLQKDYILNNLGDIRVQDPMMYPKPQLEIHNNGQNHYKTIIDMV